MCYHPDIETEKAHQRLFQRITSFDKSTMRQVSTEEKVVLPSPEGDVHTLVCCGEHLTSVITIYSVNNIFMYDEHHAHSSADLIMPLCT